ncbi:MAG: Gfo/Idh/MocA family oxidoreductase [Planctomycetota bacterium]|nr:Gfo/Idh/MocA family oxidoreductase [Planctomycetota bacterium]MDA1106419.1 Gfo/Idh/MocA family oxidoreductase [Planctomycetota bacterium]
MAGPIRSSRPASPAAGHVGVALLGTKFMGRAHSNAWGAAPKFFDLPMTTSLEVVAGRDIAQTHAFAKRWGWRQATAEWRDAIEDPMVSLVDVATPNHVHREQSIAALEAGRSVACEKPLAGTLVHAREMATAARKVKKCRTFVWFNYRRCPAVALAHQLVREGKLGRIFHVRASYLQDWGGPATPLLWRFQASKAGSGAHGDLNAHIIDMARFITGLEFQEVVGAIEETFVKEREILDAAARAPAISAGGAKRSPGKLGRSNVDDAVLFLARFRGGAIGSFEATRLATGNKNRNAIEVNGEHGSIAFDFERMNELRWWDNTLPQRLRGWSTINCTESVHPYAGNYWPSAHLIGYEHGFTSMAADIVRVLGGESPLVPLPDFDDALQTQAVLEAALVAARKRVPVRIKDVLR